MTTGIELIEETRALLFTGSNERVNVLDVTIDDNDTAAILRFAAIGVVDGTVLSIEREDVLVTAVSGSAPASTATIIRGYNGTTAVAHTAGVIIRVSTKYSDNRLFRELNEAFQEISSPLVGLFRIKPLEFAYNPSQAGYNLNAPDLIDIWRVRFQSPGPLMDWPVFRREHWRLDQDADTVDFPQGKQLVLKRPAYPGMKVRVSYKATFALLTSPTDDVLAVTGLHNEAHRLVPYIAAIGATIGREIKRSATDTQPEPRRAQEVPMSASSQAVRHLQARADSIIQDELARLNQRYPEQI